MEILPDPSDAPAPDDLSGLDVWWFATDRTGCIGLFRTAGTGGHPAPLLVDEIIEVVNRLLLLPRSTAVRFLRDPEPAGEPAHAAECGLFFYDGQVHGGPYRIEAIPETPIRIEDVPSELTPALESIRLSISFSETLEFESDALPGLCDPAGLTRARKAMEPLLPTPPRRRLGRLERRLAQDQNIRVIGFDDGPFTRSDARVPVAGVVCNGTLFEGMLWENVDRDGEDATETLAAALNRSKFKQQLDLVLLDGIAFGGFNMVDLPRLHAEVGLPCIAVMRRVPDSAAVERALRKLPNVARRLDLLSRAGTIFRSPPFVFQVAGLDHELARCLLPRLCRQGLVPEALRIAHFVAGAVVRGQSGHRA